jgi:hypothetical protein
MSFNETHYRKYEGQTFYKKKKEIRKFAMRDQIIINIILFREKNLNYFFPSIDEKLFKNNFNSS